MVIAVNKKVQWRTYVQQPLSVSPQTIYTASAFSASSSGFPCSDVATDGFDSSPSFQPPPSEGCYVVACTA